jgi:nucleotide-binding universal stress UspA family protein
MSAPFRRILVGIDFSPASAQALDVAVSLASALRSHLTLFHVYPIPGFAFPETVVPAPPDVVEQLVAENRARLDELAARARAAGVPAEIAQAPGAPHAELLRRAAEGFDLLVLGTHGRTGPSHALLGSVAERVVRKSPIPVLTIRSGK